ncbi:MAG: nuclear transport factor 2 family protein [Vicinamibacterales bacterium]|nr:nuclear transport factor 2 family protein [Vicinamibacterales bacterium]
MNQEALQQFTRRMFMSMSGLAAAGAVGGSALAEAQTMTDKDRKNIEVVKGMSAAWATGDAAKIAAFMHPKIAFRGSAEKMDSPPMVGVETFLKSMTGFLKATRIEMRILDAFALDPVVVTCHHQLFENKERGLHEDLYIGCFFMEDGKIREWNDYGIIPYAQPRAKDTAKKGKFIKI